MGNKKEKSKFSIEEQNICKNFLTYGATHNSSAICAGNRSKKQEHGQTDFINSTDVLPILVHFSYQKIYII